MLLKTYKYLATTILTILLVSFALLFFTSGMYSYFIIIPFSICLFIIKRYGYYVTTDNHILYVRNVFGLSESFVMNECKKITIRPDNFWMGKTARIFIYKNGELFVFHLGCIAFSKKNSNNKSSKHI